MNESTDAGLKMLPRPVANLRLFVIYSYGLLIAYFAVLNLLAFEGLKLAAIFVWLIQILPLIIFARSLYFTHLRTYGWLCFVVLLYFIHAVMVAFDPSRRILGIAEVTICCLLFVALVLFISKYKEHFQVNM